MKPLFHMRTDRDGFPVTDFALCDVCGAQAYPGGGRPEICVATWRSFGLHGCAWLALQPERCFAVEEV
jgi:hypothetical protein